MEKLKERFCNFQYKGIIAVTVIFALIAAILFVERSGISFNYEKRKLSFLPQEKIVTKEEALRNLEKSTLILYNSGTTESVSAYEQFCMIFSDMKVGFSAVDLAKKAVPDFNKYEKAVILLSDLTPMGESVLTMCDWVYDGGNVLFALTLQKTAHVAVMENKFGVVDSSYTNALVNSIYVEKDFMVGGGRAFEITDGYESAWAVQLNPEAVKIHAYTNDGKRVPLIWEADYGKGKFVVDNFGVCEKATRGFFAASYSLLGDVCVYPVINGAAFYLDDFPSQIPSGSSIYIQRDYNTTIRDFYVNVWWPDMMNFADKYGMRYTGLAIECYDDTVDGTIKAAPDKGTFLNFGNMLMRQGGEIGYHGYNHQPLCLDNCDYKGIYDYKHWESYEAMKSAFDELVSFCKELFPDVEMSVYVPPSNLLSDEGREFLLREYPYIKTISGIYFKDANLDFSCTQEFDVSKEGVVDQPRIVMGCKLDAYMEMALISELNLHFVNNYFSHPDDALDPERGAQMGWENLKMHLGNYLEYLYTAAPGIRNFTGSELSAAVQRFCAVSVSKKITKDKMSIKINNFYDEAQLFVRFNERKPLRASGGKLTHITGNLYLLEAKNETVEIALK